MRQRVIVGAILRNSQNQILILKMPDNYGAYPGQWGLVGGGVEPGENVSKAMKREVKEETNLEITNLNPYTFHDVQRTKILEDGTTEEQHLVFLLFDCEVVDPSVIKLNHEWDTYAWVSPAEFNKYNLNEATKTTFTQKGWL